MKLQGSPGKERQERQEKYQYVSTVSQQYGEDFWRLKAERLSEAVEQVKSENVKLSQRCVEMGRVEQELREKIATYEDDWKKRSRRMTTERVSDKFQEIYQDKITSTAELQRLHREIRVIKNTHEVESLKLTEENKRLRRELEEKGVLQEQAKENLNKERSIGKLSEEIRHLKRRVASGEEAMARVREEKARVLADNEELRRELQEGKWREKLAQKEEQDRLIGFGKNLEELRVHKMNSSAEERTSEPEVLIPPPSSELAKVALDLLDEGEKNEHEKVLQESKEENSRLRRQIVTLEKKEGDFKQRLKLEQNSLDNEKFSQEVRLRKAEGELMESKTEILDVLRKLSPLLYKENEPVRCPQNAENRASLSILHIFLKKYKIQAF